jgi:S-adenosylmethionine-diacylglycerol 3-amino-3-carboxypropyl transferase
VTAASVRDRIAWDRIRYASVWEDADVLCDALAPVAAGGRLLSVASAGDNALALLTLDPAEVVAVDLNPAQLACLELRAAAFRRLEDVEIPGFLGAEPGGDRAATYRAVRAELSPAARDFWDARDLMIERGVIHVGRFERYLRAFGGGVLRLVHSRRTIRALRDEKSDAERRRFYDEVWDNRRWRLLFRVFFSRLVMGGAGRDPAQFAQVEGSVAERILERTRYALAELDTHTNPYLAYILTGTFPPEARPRYLRPGSIPVIRERLDRLTIRLDGVDDPDGPFDGYNLSDVFEYMDAEEHRRVHAALLARARPGARLVYWNLLVPRSAPAEVAGRVRLLDGLAAELHVRDRAWFYAALRVEEVAAPDGSAGAGP